jgi:hypothetical protein
MNSFRYVSRFFFFFGCFALLSFLSPERKSKYGRDDYNKRKEKEEINTTKHSRIGGFISFSFKSFVSVGNLAITCGVVLRPARSLFSGRPLFGL